MPSQDYLHNLRHSAAHLLAAAVVRLYPNAKPTIGPVIENGFYYDFDLVTPISQEELPGIESEMHQILPSWKSFTAEVVSKEEALKRFAGNPYKQELIEELSAEGQTLTIYHSGEFTDLCRGGHLDAPSEELKYFKLLSVAGAYWRGSEKNKMLTRIYGTAFPTQKELEDYMKVRQEAEEKDHRKIGKDLDLFVFSDLVGKGLPLFTSRGASVRRELERFVVDEELKRGYEHVVTPPLAKVDLYRTSGHYPYYKDTMYPAMVVDEEELILRPMTCPHHFMLYKSRLRSYKELPIRYAELSPQFRYEKSGELTGLLRVRTFCLADAHIFAIEEQASRVINEVLDLIEHANGVLGMKKGEDYRYRLSLGDRRDEKKYYKDDTAWEKAELVLREVLNSRNVPSFEAPGEAAFYGPKIDIQINNIHGKEETAFTVQYDFVMPKRFALKFIDNDGKEKQPVVIHRASIGAIERTMALLIEKYAGAFPLWLAPIQVVVLPISDKHLDYAQKVHHELRDNRLRVELDGSQETLSKRIRNWEMQKVPYLVVVGDKEEELKSVAVRKRREGDKGAMKIGEFIALLLKEIRERK